MVKERIYLSWSYNLIHTPTASQDERGETLSSFVRACWDLREREVVSERWS